MQWFQFLAHCQQYMGRGIHFYIDAICTQREIYSQNVDTKIPAKQHADGLNGFCSQLPVSKTNLLNMMSQRLVKTGRETFLPMLHFLV